MHCYEEYWNIFQAAVGHVSHNTTLKVKQYLDDDGYFDEIWYTLVEIINVT
jgi:hypothetical protein